jgi:hypothetical protein
MSEPERERCASPVAPRSLGCFGLVCGYLDFPDKRLPVCSACARQFVHDALEMGFVAEIAGHVAGEPRERGLPRHVVEALERRKQRLALRAR